MIVFCFDVDIFITKNVLYIIHESINNDHTLYITKKFSILLYFACRFTCSITFNFSVAFAKLICNRIFFKTSRWVYVSLLKVLQFIQFKLFLSNWYILHSYKGVSSNITWMLYCSLPLALTVAVSAVVYFTKITNLVFYVNIVNAFACTHYVFSLFSLKLRVKRAVSACTNAHLHTISVNVLKGAICS